MIPKSILLDSSTKAQFHHQSVSARYKTTTTVLIAFLTATSFVLLFSVPIAKPPISVKSSVKANAHVMQSVMIETLQNESMLAESLSCLKLGRVGGSMMYYSAKHSACLPYPSSFATSEPTVYTHPGDATLSTVMATIDNDGSGPCGTFRRDATVVKANPASVIEKLFPSIHSRWLVEQWRLWEGEVEVCPMVSKMNSMGETALHGLQEYVTAGQHNPSLPNNLYDIRNFCVDELEGTLIGFSASDQATIGGFELPGLNPFQAWTEHVIKSKFLSMEQFFHWSNRETVQLLNPMESVSWKEVVTASIEAHHRRSQNGNMSSARSLAPEILFVEGQTLIVPTVGKQMDNPGHQFHRVGTFSALARMIKAETLLILVDIIAEDPVDRVYRTMRHCYGDCLGLDCELLPSYLVEKDEKKSGSCPQNNNATPATTLSLGELRKVTTWKTRSDYHPPIHKLAAADSQAGLSRLFPFDGLAGPLLSSGEEGCGDVRCGQDTDIVTFCGEEMRDKRRRCGRTQAVINVALAATHDVGGGRKYRSDTQNYSTRVWGLAVRETMRESKRVRRDTWLLSRGKPAAVHERLAEPYRYVELWRARVLVKLTTANSSTTAPLPSKQVMLEEYFLEYFASRLEAHNHAERKQSVEPAKTRRQLICYRRAAVGHVFHDRVQQYNPPGTIGLSTNANCNLKDTLRHVYESVWARYGTCFKDSDEPDITIEEQKRTNRDAHPVFRLNDDRRLALQEAFISSKTKLERALAAITVHSKTYLSANENETIGEIENIQKTYDDQLMSYFAWGNTKHKSASRPIRIFIAYRSTTRVLSHWRHHLSALLRSDLGKLIDLQFEEGLAEGSFGPTDQHYSLKAPLNTARARQFHNYLSTDLFLGPHGADMHSSAFIKPSGLTVELNSDGYDFTNTKTFSGGFFSSFAYARNVGYLKVMIARKWVWESEKREKWENDHHTYMSLPDLRHTLSVAVCSWLAMNAVRLTDEDLQSNASTDFSFLVPWWCRGGSKAIVNGAISRLRERKGEAPLSTELPGFSPYDQTFFESRASQTMYGFHIPVCQPLQSTIGWSATKLSNELSLDSTITQQQLNKLQSDCARAVTYVSYGDSPLLVRRRLVESLQSLLEGIVFFAEHSAQQAASLIVNGVAAITNNPPYSTEPAIWCGFNPLLTENATDRDGCLTVLLGALIRHNGTNSPRSVKYMVADSFHSYLLEHPRLSIDIQNENLRIELIAYIVTKFHTPASKTIRTRNSLMETQTFSYGWNCLTKKEKSRKRRGR